MQSLVLSQKVFFFLKQSFSVLQQHLSGDVPWTCLCHESSRFELIPQSSVFFPCDPSFLSFDLPVPCFPGWNSAVFKDLNSFQHLAVHFCAHLLRLPTVHLFWSTILCLAQPEHVLHQIRTAPCLSILLTSPMSRSPSSQFWGQKLRPNAMSLHLHVLTASSATHASILAGRRTPLHPMLRLLSFLIHENPFFFWLRLKHSLSIPAPSSEIWLRAACKAADTSSRSC